MHNKYITARTAKIYGQFSPSPFFLVETLRRSPLREDADMFDWPLSEPASSTACITPLLGTDAARLLEFPVKTRFYFRKEAEMENEDTGKM